MIRTALADEPGLGLEFERVVADGRRRRARRRLGALSATAAGIVAAVATTAVVTGGSTREPAPPAGVLSPAPTTTATASPGCVVPAMTGGFADQPRGTATPEELAESGRLTDAVRQSPLPLPPGVEATPLTLCVVAESWGGDFRLGDRTVVVYVRALGGQPAGECVFFDEGTRCSTRTLPDGSTARVTVEPGAEAVLVSADVWRADGTFVHVVETGGTGSTTRVLTDDQLVALAAAPQLRVRWQGRPVPADPSDRRAAELDPVLAGALPAGLAAEPVAAGDEPLRFRVRQGGYRAFANLSDAAGRGWLMVTVEKPGEGEVSCPAGTTCRLVDLAGGRRAALTTGTDGGLTRLALHARAADGSRLTVHTSNAAVAGDGSESGTPTRPTPPLGEADLIRIAELPDLHW
ncbi:hypothetical protein ACFXGA_21730 [Actinosynnema sp. NPDC059335]|uniref:hypothetical protein n=1 Tax=Actinosynnema sp. NPDC059335 TaxID=3346804 RepID=UPI0036715CE1